MSNIQIKCSCCNNDIDEEGKTFKIVGRKQGSKFLGVNVNIHLCKNCLRQIDEKCFDNKEIDIWGDEHIYHREDLLEKFIESFIVENQEEIFNIEGIAKEDWISDHLDDSD